MMVHILTYTTPHRKTYDALCLLKAKGYENVTVWAVPMMYQKRYSPLVLHRNNEMGIYGGGTISLTTHIM